MTLPLEKATYRARAVGCGFGEADNDNATKTIATPFRIVDHPEFTGEHITWLGYFTDKTAERTIESLQHMGWKGEDLSELADLDEARCSEMLPDVVEIVCEPEEYDGQWRLRVRWVNRARGGFAFKKPLAGNELKSFAAQMRNTVRSVRGAGFPVAGNGARPSKPAPHPNAPGADDDDSIPF